MFDMELAWDRQNRVQDGISRHTLRVRLTDRTACNGTLPLRIAVALDTSGSMEGPKLERAKDACLEIIRRLRPGDTFFLAGFGTSLTPIVDDLDGGSPDKSSAESAIRNLQASGITRTDLALEWQNLVLGGGTGCSRLGALITDGKPTNENGHRLQDLSPLVDEAGRMGNAGISICAVALGDAARMNTAFLIDISTRGQGAFVFAETPEELGQRLSDRFTAAQSVTAQDVSLSLKRRLPGSEIRNMCRLRPQYIALSPEIADEEFTLRAGTVQPGASTDILIEMELPPLGFGERLGKVPVLDLTALSGEKPIARAVASVAYVNSELEAQQLNADVDKDRLLWEINVNAEAAMRGNNPVETGLLLSKVQQAADQVGESGLANQAGEQAAKIMETGVMNASEVARLLDQARNRGGS